MAEADKIAVSYDVIVAGGGPAGASAAFFLRRAGKRVLVLEKECLPRYKTCGGGISLRFLKEQFPFPFDDIFKTNISCVSYVTHAYEIDIPLAGDVIGMAMRDELDEYLLRQSKAEVIQEQVVRSVQELEDRVIVETEDGQRYTAAYVVGADGANSLVARSLGLRPRRLMAAALEAEVPVTPEVMRRFSGRMVFIFNEIRLGYLWIFPKPDHLTIGVGALRPRQGALQKILVRVAKRYGIPLDGVPLRGHPIPIYTHRERVSSARTLLVGDAAGLVDPLTGEGIRFAIKSGRLAAESILKEHPEAYARDLFWSIGFDHIITALIARLFYFFPDLFLLFGTPNPFSTQGVVDMLSDRITGIEFVLFSIVTLPVFLFTELTALVLGWLGRADLSNRLRATVYPEDVRASYRDGVKA